MWNWPAAVVVLSAGAGARWVGLFAVCAGSALAGRSRCARCSAVGKSAEEL